MRTFRGIVESNVAPSTDVIWLHNKELKYFTNGKWESLNEIPILPKENNDIITLEEGNNKAIKESNLNKLKNTKDTFFVSTQYGHGVGIWNSKDGGQIHVITPYGSTIYYSIKKNGELSTPLESPDLYLNYISAGGQLDKNTFVKKLKELIEL